MANKGELRKYGIFSIVWILSVCLLFQFLTNNELNTFHKKLVVSREFDRPSNQIGAFKFIRYSSEESSKPSLSVSFDNLLIENNNLGIFKSALHQLVQIKNFKFSAFQYPENSTALVSNDFLQDFPSKNDFIKQLKTYTELLMDKSDGWRVDFDITSAVLSELVINDFNYSIFSTDELVLSIQSKRAMASYDSTGLILRGRVIIKTGKENVLETNHIQWDVGNKIFAVKGVYALNQNGTVKTGKNIILDYNLNEVPSERTVKDCQKETPKCFAKL